MTATWTAGPFPDDRALEEYRAGARTWLAQNLERRAPGAALGRPTFGGPDKTVEEIAEQRKAQRRLYEAGYAGITWPKEYGGQGLHPAYDRVFQEESRGFRLPDLGIAGG